MRHLTTEELARLVDEPPTEAEATHVERCESCSRELEELKRQTARLTALPDPPVPAAVLDRGLDVVRREATRRSRASLAGGGWTRLAASVAVFLLGTATGAFVVAPAARGAGGDGPVAGAVDPAAALAAAEAEYVQALANYARSAGVDDGLDPLNRLAALEGIVLTTRSALREAPADPVINTYHLAAVSHRDALLRDIADATEQDEWF